MRLRRIFVAFLTMAMLFPAQPAFGLTRLKDGVARLSDAVSGFEGVGLDKDGLRSDIDKIVADGTSDLSSKVEGESKAVDKLKSAVSALRGKSDVTQEDLDALSRSLRTLEEDDRRGWSFTPPAAGHATGLDIARAAVDVATSAQPGPEYTDPSEPHAAYYVRIHDQFLAGEDYRACSVVTSTAIHWSGADPDFPRNTSSIVHQYCANSPRWKFVGHGPDKSEMLPGDIFTSDYHTYMYVGNEVVRERFPDSGADVYTGGNQLPYLYWDEYSNRNYDVYRFVG